jgi:hypothetical protein
MELLDSIHALVWDNEEVRRMPARTPAGRHNTLQHSSSQPVRPPNSQRCTRVTLVEACCGPNTSPTRTEAAGSNAPFKPRGEG